VLCARERLEAVARRNPASRAELDEVVELRRWQREVLGAGFVKALDAIRRR
jgi:ribonuclease D